MSNLSTSVRNRRRQRRLWIFADFDGVLNSDAFYARAPRLAEKGELDKTLVRRFGRLVQKAGPGCRVVISSTWRIDTSVPELREILESRGFPYPKRVIARTRDLGEESLRGFEILAYLKEHKCLSDPFVVLDDTSDMDGVEEHFVKTDPRVGLTEQDVLRALDILGVKR